MNLFATVGTYPKGWDAFVAGVDEIGRRLGLSGMIQTGHSRVTSTTLTPISFLPRDEMLDCLSQADLVIGHGGIGTIGDCLRVSKRFICIPRPVEMCGGNEGQAPVCKRLASAYSFPVVTTFGEPLSQMVELHLSQIPRTKMQIPNPFGRKIEAALLYIS